ncbi:MAG: DinB family protein [Acidobacteria bacterium]|nr:MAG: DinB family protein [Acidobacteriota bacterium]
MLGRMKKLLFAAILLVIPSTMTAQSAPQAPPTYEQVVARTWKTLHNKILDMAKDFPEDKFGWKPHPDSRSMEQEFRHVTIGLEMTTAQLKGEKFDFVAREKADDGKPHTRASVVAEMEAAIAASYPLVESQPKPLLVGWLDHQGEHYGKMVDGYRVNGLVPPVSRPKK